MRRALIKLGDKTTAGGTVVDGEPASKHHGTPLSYHGASIYCPACKQTGRACNVPPMRPMGFMGKQALLENDICLCGCQPPPRLIASQSTMHVSFDHEELARMGFGPAGQPLPKAVALNETTKSSFKETDQESTLPDDPVLICPNMSNAQFAAKVMELCEILEKKIQIRLGELQRWNAQDQRSVVTWFGVADASIQQTLFDGLSRMLSVIQSLRPENFVRWSETALTHVGCAPGRPRGETRPVAAAVCKPDTKTHTIAIALKFCEMDDYDDRKDSRLLVIAHEVSHFLDTMDTNDDYYFIWNSIALAKIKYPKCITIADSIAGYIVIHTPFPENFGAFIRTP